MTRFLISAAVFAALTVPAAAGQLSFHDGRGNYTGSAFVRSNGSASFHDRSGAYVGSSITRGRTTIVYGANGSRVGTSTRSGR
jgi:hypothetical protein